MQVRPLPAPWRQGGWRIITWRPCVHRKWRRGGGQLHVVYLLLVALPANHIDFTVAREGNFMIRLRANWVTFPIIQKLEIKICKSNCLEVATKKPITYLFSPFSWVHDCNTFPGGTSLCVFVQCEQKNNNFFISWRSPCPRDSHSHFQNQESKKFLNTVMLVSPAGSYNWAGHPAGV